MFKRSLIVTSCQKPLPARGHFFNKQMLTRPPNHFLQAQHPLHRGILGGVQSTSAADQPHCPMPSYFYYDFPKMVTPFEQLLKLVAFILNVLT